MKTTLRVEEFALFILGIIVFSFLEMSWWWFPVLLLLPDIGMIGYLFNTKVGAFFYNLFHHRAVSVILLLIGYFYDVNGILLAGVIMFSHIAFDRMLGYGLKYPNSFKNTHLGEIGKK